MAKKAFGLALASTMLLAACGGGGTEDASGDGHVELTFWLFGTTKYEELAEVYMEENPGIKINIQEGDNTDHHNNLFTALSTGSGAPDLALVEINEIERYRDAQDRFINLYDHGAEELKDNYLDWVWETAENRDGDFLFGLPTDIGPTAMFYRTDVFEEAGLPTDPEEVSATIQTWDDYTEMANTIYEKTGTIVTDSPELVYNALRDQAKEHYFNENEELIVENNAAIREAYDRTVELIENGVVGSLELWTPEWGGAMDTGDYATLLGPAWMIAVIQGNAPNAAGNWSIADMPEGAGNWGGSFVTIPTETDHPEEAYDFVKWLLSPENQLQSFVDAGLFPSAPAVYEEEAFINHTDEYFNGLNTAAVFGKAAQQVESVYKGRNYMLVQEEILTALDNVNSNGADPDAEWDAAMKRINDRLQRG
ncbi:sugar transporter sugar-binding protein [Niallia circulans]|uniref:ABC transporter substrate-binding protein n=1 Tax=Shouchella clausii TaxID=79880 RepID=UPI000BA69F4C|nr:extracellular solute-binding protein [Shouchella clausii]MCM3549783.1 extracellular solute-binding protein [Shouchella clausii]PAF14886.1 sugar transporter [Shouchella clausii]SPU21517.1 sugar transporter sugar-binding protein [Niallia circulans]